MEYPFYRRPQRANEEVDIYVVYLRIGRELVWAVKVNLPKTNILIHGCYNVFITTIQGCFTSSSTKKSIVLHCSRLNYSTLHPGSQRCIT